jgi:hypothetical protein
LTQDLTLCIDIIIDIVDTVVDIMFDIIKVEMGVVGGESRASSAGIRSIHLVPCGPLENA